MSGTYVVHVGDRGRLVLPAELRRRARLTPGTALTLVATDDATMLLTQEQLRDLVRRDLAGTSLVDELLGERRQEAAREDALRGTA